MFVAYGGEKCPKIKTACSANRSAQNKTPAAKLAVHFKIRVVESRNTPSRRVAYMRPYADYQIPGAGIYFTTLGNVK